MSRLADGSGLACTPAGSTAAYLHDRIQVLVDSRNRLQSRRPRPSRRSPRPGGACPVCGTVCAFRAPPGPGATLSEMGPHVPQVGAALVRTRRPSIRNESASIQRITMSADGSSPGQLNRRTRGDSLPGRSPAEEHRESVHIPDPAKSWKAAERALNASRQNHA